MNTTTDVLVGWTAASNTRGTYTLIWSCLATIFACTWTILHLNVPGLQDSTCQRFLRKAKWMAISILFPEFILSKAICDLRLALYQLRQFGDYLRDKRQDRGIRWITMTVTPPGRRTSIQDWEWKVQYPKCTRLIYGLLGLSAPTDASKWYSDLVGWWTPLVDWCSRLINGQRQSTQKSAKNGPPCPDLGLCEEQPVLADTAGQSLSIDGQSRGQPSLASIQDQQIQREKSPKPRREAKSQAWTAVHSYYAQMGGLVYEHWGPRAQEHRALTPWKLTSAYHWEAYGTSPEIDHPLMHLVLNEDDIKDKSKADILAKGIAALQIAWLIVNLIARGITGLPITQLEIATAAFAVMAIFTYMANFWKPKEVLQPTILTIPLFGRPARYGVDPSQSLKDRLWSPAKFVQSLQDGKIDRVSNDSVWLEGNTPLIFWLMAASSLLFGGLHCIAWNYEFPSRAELICWRTASLISAFLPVLLLALNLILGYISSDLLESRILAAFRTKIEPWNGRPDEYWRLVTSPSYLSWSDAELSALLSMPKEDRTWNQKPRVEDINTTGGKRMQPNHSALQFMKKFPGLLASIRASWQRALEDESAGLPSMRRVDVLTGPSRGDFERRLLSPTCHGPEKLEVWEDYESFVLQQVPDFDRSDARPLQFLWQVYNEADKESNLMQSVLRYIEIVSNVLNIFSGVLYAFARLSLLVIIFSSLRATPERVYQTTFWIQFFPNIS